MEAAIEKGMSPGQPMLIRSQSQGSPRSLLQKAGNLSENSQMLPPLKSKKTDEEAEI